MDGTGVHLSYGILTLRRIRRSRFSWSDPLDPQVCSARRYPSYRQPVPLVYACTALSKGHMRIFRFFYGWTIAATILISWAFPSALDNPFHLPAAVRG